MGYDLVPGDFGISVELGFRARMVWDTERGVARTPSFECGVRGNQAGGAPSTDTGQVFGRVRHRGRSGRPNRDFGGAGFESINLVLARE